MEELTSLNIALDILCLQETWLSDSHIPPFFDIEGYTIVKQAKHASEHGGLLLYIKKTISFTEIHLTKHRSWENQFINLRIGSQSIILGNIHRPPHKTISELENFNEEFNAVVHKLPSSKNLIIAGDFNINLLSLASPPSPHIPEFVNNVISNGLIPKITLPTRITDTSCTLIDNFLCKLDPTWKETAGILIRKISDHQAYFITIPVNPNQ
jgi:hypothetical protein